MKVYIDRRNKRLIYVGEHSSPDFWDSHWDSEDLIEDVKRGKDDKFILKILAKYVPDRKGRFLEGGCSRGQVVYCMQTHGYECVGVDFATGIIGRVKAIVPELDVRVADVRDLPFPDNYFTGYWSLGVIEHFSDGYDDILSEMQRVLTCGGYVFLTFPYMSLLRRFKAKVGLYRESDGGDKKSFYQYILNPNSVIMDFEAAGFKLESRTPYEGIKGFKDEVKLFGALLQGLYDYQGGNLFVRGFRFALDRLLAIFTGHMILLVFKKDQAIRRQ